MAVRNPRLLTAWQKSLALVEVLYRATRRSPHDQHASLMSQIRRTVTAIPMGIAAMEQSQTEEGRSRCARSACGAVHELRTLLASAQRLHCIQPNTARMFADLAADLARLIQHSQPAAETAALAV